MKYLAPALALVIVCGFAALSPPWFGLEVQYADDLLDDFVLLRAFSDGRAVLLSRRYHSWPPDPGPAASLEVVDAFELSGEPLGAVRVTQNELVLDAAALPRGGLALLVAGRPEALRRRENQQWSSVPLPASMPSMENEFFMHDDSELAIVRTGKLGPSEAWQWNGEQWTRLPIEPRQRWLSASDGSAWARSYDAFDRPHVFHATLTAHTIHTEETPTEDRYLGTTTSSENDAYFLRAIERVESAGHTWRMGLLPLGFRSLANRGPLAFDAEQVPFPYFWNTANAHQTVIGAKPPPERSGAVAERLAQGVTELGEYFWVGDERAADYHFAGGGGVAWLAANGLVERHSQKGWSALVVASENAQARFSEALAALAAWAALSAIIAAFVYGLRHVFRSSRLQRWPTFIAAFVGGALGLAALMPLIMIAYGGGIIFAPLLPLTMAIGAHLAARAFSPSLRSLGASIGVSYLVLMALFIALLSLHNVGLSHEVESPLAYGLWAAALVAFAAGI